jgi:hypothetical protein
MKCITAQQMHFLESLLGLRPPNLNYEDIWEKSLGRLILCFAEITERRLTATSGNKQVCTTLLRVAFIRAVQAAIVTAAQISQMTALSFHSIFTGRMSGKKLTAGHDQILKNNFKMYPAISYEAT